MAREGRAGAAVSKLRPRFRRSSYFLTAVLSSVLALATSDFLSSPLPMLPAVLVSTFASVLPSALAVLPSALAVLPLALAAALALAFFSSFLASAFTSPLTAAFAAGVAG